ncbi:MAG: hypothetical protein ACO24P_00025 [Candidatus Nanopelagicaceae bacterium]
MDPFEYIQALYEADPEGFNKGFEEFCLQLRQICVDFVEENPQETPFTAGFKFASSIAFDQITIVIQRSIKMAMQQQEVQDQMKTKLEQIYNM